MHRVIAGINLWALLFLITALVLGTAHSRYHVYFALFATVFAMLAQCAIFALFMGATKLLKEHVQSFDLPTTLLDRTNTLMIPLFRWASMGSLSVLLLAILGGLAISGDAPPVLHVVVGLVCIVVLLLVVPREVRHLAQMHEILLDMETALPDSGTAPTDPEAPPDLRPRALVYVGSTCLAMALGYKYIAGLPVPSWLFVTATGFSLICLAMAGALSLKRAPERT